MREALTRRNQEAVLAITKTIEKLRFYSLMSSEYSLTPAVVLDAIKVDLLENAGSWGGRVAVFMATMETGRYRCLPSGGWNLENVSINKV